MPIYIGNTELTNLQIGSTTIDKVFVGNTQVYPGYIIPTELIFISASGTSIYTYDPLNDAITLVSTPGYDTFDIAKSNTKVWVQSYPSGDIVEYDYVISPFSFTYNRTIDLTDSSFTHSLSYIGTTYLLSARVFSGNTYATIGRYDISGSTTSLSSLFNLPANRLITGDVLYDADTTKIIVSSYDSSTSTRYITQYFYDGTVDYELSGVTGELRSLYKYNNKIYAINLVGNIYEVTSGGMVSTGQDLDIINVFGAA